MAELLTKKQKERRARDMRVASQFASMRAQYPDASQTLIIEEMATRNTYGLSSKYGIRSALIRVGAIKG